MSKVDVNETDIFSNGFLSDEQISTALSELNAKLNFLYYTQESLFSESQAADVCCGLVVEADEVQSQRAAPWLHLGPETRHVARKASPESHFLKLFSIVKDLSFFTLILIQTRWVYLKEILL